MVTATAEPRHGTEALLATEDLFVVSRLQAAQERAP
jgi:hypothetical protein